MPRLSNAKDVKVWMAGESRFESNAGEDAAQSASMSRARIGAFSVASVAAVGLLVVAWNARRLRPIADDYCAGQNALLGFTGSIEHWFLTWSGDVGARAIDFFVVGWPLVGLPWNLGSVIAFLTTAACVAGGVMAVTARCVGEPGGASSRLTMLCLLPVVSLSWWIYWWAPVRFSGLVPMQAINDNALNLAQSITVWQIVNSSYALIPGLFLAIFALSLGTWCIRPRASALVMAFIGLFFGTTGLVLAATVLGCLLVVLLAELLLRRSWLPSRLPAAALAVGLVVGMAISYLAPGSQTRSDLLAQQAPLAHLTPISLLTWTVPRAGLEWALAVLNLGTVVSFGIVAASAWVLQSTGARLQQRELAWSGLGLVVLALALSLVNRASEAVAYPAFWHQVSTRTAVFAGVCCLALSLGARIGNRPNERSNHVPARVGLSLVTAGCLVAGSLSLITMLDTVHERYERWQVGPAPMVAITDISDPEGWEMDCWSKLAESHDAPPRGVLP